MLKRLQDILGSVTSKRVRCATRNNTRLAELTDYRSQTKGYQRDRVRPMWGTISCIAFLGTVAPALVLELSQHAFYHYLCRDVLVVPPALFGVRSRFPMNSSWSCGTIGHNSRFLKNKNRDSVSIFDFRFLVRPVETGLTGCAQPAKTNKCDILLYGTCVFLFILSEHVLVHLPLYTSTTSMI